MPKKTQKVALITGTTGQDGSYLSEFLLEKNYSVHGMVRTASIDNTERIRHLMDRSGFNLHYGDLTDSHSISTLIEKTMPDEVYNLASQSHVGKSFEIPEQTADVTALGVLRVLEAIRQKKPNTKFYQASTSELFGEIETSPQNEDTKFHPRSPYAVSKLFGYWITINYREAYKMFACNGILFNHESPRRGEDFVTKKIVRQMAEIFKREREILHLGNLDAKRDWGFAGDFVEAMWLMLQQKEPEDFVIATGKTHSVREFVEETAKHLGMEIEWRGRGVKEEGINKKTGEVIIKVDPKYFRPAEVEVLTGDYSKAKKKLGWKPKTKFSELVKMMIENEL